MLQKDGPVVLQLGSAPQYVVLKKAYKRALPELYQEIEIMKDGVCLAKWESQVKKPVNILILLHAKPVNKQMILTLYAPMTTKVVCFFRLLKMFKKSLQQCGPRSDCS